MNFKGKPFQKLMMASKMIKFDSKGFYTAKNDEEAAFLNYVKGIEKVGSESQGVESKPKPKTKRPVRPDSFL